MHALTVLRHLNPGSGQNIAVLAAVNMLQIIIIIILFVITFVLYI